MLYEYSSLPEKSKCLYGFKTTLFCELLITSGVYLYVFIETDLDSVWFSILYLQSILVFPHSSVQMITIQNSHHLHLIWPFSTFSLSLLKNKGLWYKKMHYTYSLNLQHCKCIAVMMCCVPKGYGIYHLCFDGLDLDGKDKFIAGYVV